MTESSVGVPQSGCVTLTFHVPDCVTVIDFVVKVGCKTPFQNHWYANVFWLAGGFWKLQCKVWEFITELQNEIVLVAGGLGYTDVAVGPKSTPQTTSQFVEPEPGEEEFVCSITNCPTEFE